MFRRMYNPLALILIGLGILGFVVKMVTNPLGVLEKLAIAAAVIAIFVFLYKRFQRKTSGRKVSGYQRAAKQSLKLRKRESRKPHRPSHLKVVNSRNILPRRRRETLEKRKREHNLTVIDGKKRKKKNRALF